MKLKLDRDLVNELKRKCPAYNKAAYDADPAGFGEMYGNALGEYAASYSLRGKLLQLTQPERDKIFSDTSRHFERNMGEMGRVCINKDRSFVECLKPFMNAAEVANDRSVRIPVNELRKLSEKAICIGAIELLLM